MSAAAVRGAGARAALAMAMLAALLALLAGVAATASAASFGAIELQSLDSLEQAESAGETAISGNGEYLAFQGVLGGLQGVFRKNLRSGQIELVAGGSAYSQSTPLPADASWPSISFEGRYVSFTSSARLMPAAHEGSNVYVRDLSVPAPPGGLCTLAEERGEDGRCAYELASARNGGTVGLSYAAANGGAIASGRVALSADGREVAFVVRAASDLTSAAAGKLTTPPLQVAVRYLDTDQTVLVSAERESVSGAMSERPVAGGAVTLTTQALTGGRIVAPGAALSGDGSTVAWLGAHIPAQVPTLHGEREQIEADDEKAANDEAYDEPLWRRIGDGPSAPTRRIVGGGDPLAPGCPPGGTLEVPACRGPYPGLASEGTRGDAAANHGWLGIQGYDGTPQLSNDGLTVALIGDPDSTSNVFVVNMREGLDRLQALRQLTREIPVSEKINPGVEAQYVVSAGDVYEVSISPDGSRIAFTSQRQQYPLAPPNYTEAPPPQLGVAELYQIDLANESLVRVTHGPGGGASLEGTSAVTVTSSGAASPSYSQNDLTLAFADTASNLVFGDANDASDAFTVAASQSQRLPGPVQIASPPPEQQPASAGWRLSVVPVVHADGSVTLDVDVPGAGTLAAAATATVPVEVRAGGRSHLPARTSGKRVAARSHRIELEPRTLAKAQLAVRAAGLFELPLRVSASYASLLRTAAGIYANIRVSFKAPGQGTLVQSLVLSLRRTGRPPHSLRARSTSKAHPQARLTAGGRAR